MDDSNIAILLGKDGSIESKVGRDTLRELMVSVLPRLEAYESREGKASLKDSGHMHVDTFIDSMHYGAGSPEAYAAFFFQMHRFPAYQQMKWRPFTEPLKLYCTFEGKRYRVTGCSRMGDIWLAKNLDRDNGYDLRQYVEQVTNWSSTP